MKKLLLIMLLPGLLLLCALLILPRLNLDLTEPPPRSGQSELADAAPLSVVTLNAAVPLARLQQLADQKIPKSLVDEERRERWKGKFLGIKTSISADVKLRIERRGKPKVRFKGNELRLRVPLKFNARIKFRGGIRPNTSTSGRLNVETRLRVGIRPDWSPAVRVDGDFEWEKRPRVGSGLISVDIADAVGDKLEDALHKAAKKLEKNLQEDLQFRGRAEQAWLAMQQPRRLSDDDNLWLLIRPKSVHLKPLHRDGDDVKLSFAIAAKIQTLLGEPAATKDPVPLPDLSPDLPNSEQFVVDVPVLAEYAALETLLTQRIGDKAIELRGGELRPAGFEVYGSNGNLVLGTRFSANPPWRLLQTRGTVWLMGRPEFDPLSETLAIRDLDYTGRVSNPLVWTANWVLQDRLRAELRQRSVFPLAERIDEARKTIQKSIRKLGNEEWKIESEVDELTVVAMEPLKDALYLRLRTRGRIAGEWLPKGLQ